MDFIKSLELTLDQFLRRMETCSSLILRNKNDSFLNRIVTYDEKWVIFGNRRKSLQSVDKNESPKNFSN
uniref:Uncharacterized protein n=1 Tax=Strongyloides venezuelensis TaxID=75913 RepID=A0A0K0FW37_STRVS